jgi:hypothetical protein
MIKDGSAGGRQADFTSSYSPVRLVISSLALSIRSLFKHRHYWKRVGKVINQSVTSCKNVKPNIFNYSYIFPPSLSWKSGSLHRYSLCQTECHEWLNEIPNIFTLVFTAQLIQFLWDHEGCLVHKTKWTLRHFEKICKTINHIINHLNSPLEGHYKYFYPWNMTYSILKCLCSKWATIMVMFWHMRCSMFLFVRYKATCIFNRSSRDKNPSQLTWRHLF